MRNTLQPQRHPSETQAEYRHRRATGDAAVARYLKGRMIHVSTRIVMLPPAGEDEKVDELIRYGEYRDVIEAARLDAKGRFLRRARTKGVTYWRNHAAN